MKDYITSFSSLSEYNTWKSSNRYVTPNASIITESDEVVTLPDYETKYLTIVSKADNNTIGWKASNANLLKTISVSTDGGQTWTDKESSTSTSGTELATLNNGDKLLVKGSNTTYATNSFFNYFKSTQNFDVSGNIMSLLYGDNFIGQTSLDGKDYAFEYLFYYSTKLVNAQNLKLPATTLASSCYYRMFSGCTSLTTAPELPATTLADSCYGKMFYNCSSLTTAPELPATTLAQNCYEAMFNTCTSLTTAPELPATTLANYCYSLLFVLCTSLTTAPELPATTLTEGCYAYMFQGCSSLTTAPVLPATTLATYCYMGMFSDCTLLNYIKCLATDISAIDCTTDWVSNVATTGTFVKKENMSDWTTGDSGIPSGWTVEDAVV